MGRRVPNTATATAASSRRGSVRGRLTIAAVRLCVAVCCALAMGFAAAAGPLPALGTSARDVTVSGVSSGGYMAVQFHIAHSESVAGAGVLAAGPYDCAAGSIWFALTRCMRPRFWSPMPESRVFRQRIVRKSEAGLIDGIEGLAGDRAWLFSGGRDETVERPVVKALASLYRSVLEPNAVRLVTLASAGHAMITVEDPDANPCGTSEPPYLNHCGALDAAGELLNYLIGPLAPPREPPPGSVRAFDQQPYLGPKPATSGMAEVGYLLVPPGCEQGGCRVHVVFHGCRQTTEQIGTRFVDNAGYQEWAWSNRLVLLFPQIRPTNGFVGTFDWLYNPRGCWDWWGYTDDRYGEREGRQIAAIQAMLDQLARSPGSR